MKFDSHYQTSKTSSFYRRHDLGSHSCRFHVRWDPDYTGRRFLVQKVNVNNTPNLLVKKQIAVSQTCHLV